MNISRGTPLYDQIVKEFNDEFLKFIVAFCNEGDYILDSQDLENVMRDTIYKRSDNAS